jgi:hypothetical protein
VRHVEKKKSMDIISTNEEKDWNKILKLFRSKGLTAHDG